jgi:ABC-type cobalamin/Fe3+-siderophores transport system ATPase subunit
MDYMYENETEARSAILNALSLINTMNNDIPNTMIVQFFFQGKSPEMIRVFKKATPEDKQKAREILQKIDISNANTYKQELR